MMSDDDAASAAPPASKVKVTKKRLVKPRLDPQVLATAQSNAHHLYRYLVMPSTQFEKQGTELGKKKWWEVLCVQKPSSLKITT